MSTTTPGPPARPSTGWAMTWSSPASCRATLASESGSNVFDFDGTLAPAVEAALKVKPDLTFEEVYRRFLTSYETQEIMNQVSPRVFEAVALRTGLVLFEGTYSGVV